MNRIIKTGYWIFVVTFVFMMLAFVLSTPAQKRVDPAPDTTINPHDFKDVYYKNNGVDADLLIWRRTGSDGLSVFGKSKNPIHNDVRVIVTVPVYSTVGPMSFWYPLGELTNMGFTQDKKGMAARYVASLYPLYIFPDQKYKTYNTIANTRQAPLVDLSASWIYPDVENPLGLREVFQITYTSKAYSKDGYEMMQYMGKKNGLGTDEMPIINCVEDINLLRDEGYINMDLPGDISDDGPYRGHYAVAPLIADPTNGVIAPDAFLWMSTRNGIPLDAEMNFVNQFGCLQATGDWCR
jgi:hypothetical protein